jgi:hypothetical protein
VHAGDGASDKRGLACRPACRFYTVLPPVANSWVTAKQLLAIQTSTSSALDHCAWVLMDRIMPRAGLSPDGVSVQEVIPISVFTVIDAGTAS